MKLLVFGWQQYDDMNIKDICLGIFDTIDEAQEVYNKSWCECKEIWQIKDNELVLVTDN